MKMKSTNTICVLLLMLVLLEMIWCEGCLKHEREALLALNAQFDRPRLSWVDNTDCCKWKRVSCNNTTRRVVEINLYSVMDYHRNWYINFSDFQVFEDLKSLVLSWNSIAGCVEYEGSRLSNVEVIDLSDNVLNNTKSILSCLDGLSSLESLDLSGNEFNEIQLHGGLQHLKHLDLSGNLLKGSLNISGGLQHLEYLDLSYNQLEGSLNISGELQHLEHLDLSHNQLEGSLNISGGFQHLEYLDLSYNKLEGSLNISGLLGSSNLEILDFSFNNISNIVVNEGSKCLTKLKVLELDGNRMDGNMLRKSLLVFPSIRELSLWDNQFNGTIVAGDFRDLGNLEHLELNYSSNLVNEFFKSIGLLTSLKVLSMSNCEITGTLLAAEWYKLKKLEELDLSENKFEGPLPSSFCNMTSLRKLELSGSNNFIGSFSSNIASLTSLEYLDFEGNQFEFPISLTPFANHSNIKFIHGGGNKVILDSQPTSQTWVPKFQLQELLLSSSNGTNSLLLPNFLLYQRRLTYLDFSGLKLETEFPKWLLENNTEIISLVLGNCSIMGTFQLPSRPLLKLESIDVSNNAITGQTPSNISSIFPNLQYLDISNNHFVGKLPSGWSQCWPDLVALDMSNNNFEGSIPSDFAEHESLLYLDLSQNKLSGSIPSFLNSATALIKLRNNELSGLPKTMFSENSSLVMLDLSYNHISNGIKDMTRSLNGTGLQILLLKGNHFTGPIPKELCQLIDINILDLSHNNFYGPIPNCLGQMPFENSDNKVLSMDMLVYDYYNFIFTTKKSSYTYTGSVLAYMSGIDLSCNKLGGNIPSELGNLTKIRALNLSYNDLKGNIPVSFSNLVQVESLDLSFNKLSGSIPSQLNKLSSLEVFSVAHNNLSGAIPERNGQFITFDERSYEGNPFLCGPPLPNSCNAFILPNGSYSVEDGDNLVDMYFFWVSFAVSYASIVLVMAIVLYINPYWRRAWFYYIELVTTNCYYFIEDNLCKFSINI